MFRRLIHPIILLTPEDLKQYASAYFRHVNAFPSYLDAFAARLSEGELRRRVLANRADEMGTSAAHPGAAHSELWLDFAEGMGAARHSSEPVCVAEVEELVSLFHCIASIGMEAEALAAFYAYESQVPRIAAAKACGLRELYAADDRTCAYFDLHATADIYHSRIWRQLLLKQLQLFPEQSGNALETAEIAARALWRALDGFEARRVTRAAA